MKKNKILLIIPGLNSGGVDNSLISFCQAFSERCDISLLIFGCAKTNIDRLPKNIKLLPSTKRLEILTSQRKDILKKYGFLWYIIKAFFYINSKLFGNKFAQRFFCKTYVNDEKYDFAISWSNDGQGNSLCFGSEYLCLNCISSKRKMLYMHNDYIKNKIECAYNNKLLNQFETVLCISQGVYDSLITYVKQPGKLKICHCFVDLNYIKEKSVEENICFNSNKINFITVCRLSYEKGIDRSLYIMNKLKTKHNNFCWFIIGNGDPKYSKLCRKLNCDDVVHFIGEKKNPFPYIRASSAYLSLSRFEGAPISIMEAKALGKKVIATEYISANEQLSNNDVVIPNDEKSIEISLDYFLKNADFNNTGLKDIEKWNAQAKDEITGILFNKEGNFV